MRELALEEGFKFVLFFKKEIIYTISFVFHKAATHFSENVYS